MAPNFPSGPKWNSPLSQKVRPLLHPGAAPAAAALTAKNAAVPRNRSYRPDNDNNDYLLLEDARRRNCRRILTKTTPKLIKVQTHRLLASVRAGCGRRRGRVVVALLVEIFAGLIQAEGMEDSKLCSTWSTAISKTSLTCTKNERNIYFHPGSLSKSCRIVHLVSS